MVVGGVSWGVALGAAGLMFVPAVGPIAAASLAGASLAANASFIISTVSVMNMEKSLNKVTGRINTLISQQKQVDNAREEMACVYDELEVFKEDYERKFKAQGDSDDYALDARDIKKVQSLLGRVEKCAQHLEE